MNNIEYNIQSFQHYFINYSNLWYKAHILNGQNIFLGLIKVYFQKVFLWTLHAILKCITQYPNHSVDGEDIALWFNGIAFTLMGTYLWNIPVLIISDNSGRSMLRLFHIFIKWILNRGANKKTFSNSYEPRDPCGKS